MECGIGNMSMCGKGNDMGNKYGHNRAVGYGST